MAPNIKNSPAIVNVLPNNALAITQSKYTTLDVSSPQDPAAINPAFDGYWEVPSHQQWHSKDAAALKPENDIYWEHPSSIPVKKKDFSPSSRNDSYWDTPESQPVQTQQVQDTSYWETPSNSAKIVTKVKAPPNSYWELPREATTKTNKQNSADYWQEENKNDNVFSSDFIVSRLVAESKKVCSRSVEVVTSTNKNDEMWEWNVDQIRPIDAYWEMAV
eukprot:CAMPEP_0118719510 /NCGR_PEP_ID=MMETSP0800-20121206/29531_1 /TAXON_ID=210618 ORGANISM="Striatella unipunctata, Strain CCMP2910" /NCGR_SAMPLE_ID=MMETSP0800 /ASSEMBLY_ACC=CAM_ASM_000638 /LENGTH=217 /DNA_ID=CAMNT_0006626919 /DNA_START=284 /DNA_END=937 /DNA_ORIENTATION=+